MQCEESVNVSKGLHERISEILSDSKQWYFELLGST